MKWPSRPRARCHHCSDPAARAQPRPSERPGGRGWCPLSVNCTCPACSAPRLQQNRTPWDSGGGTGTVRAGRLPADVQGAPLDLGYTQQMRCSIRDVPVLESTCFLFIRLQLPCNWASSIFLCKAWRSAGPAAPLGISFTGSSLGVNLG